MISVDTKDITDILNKMKSIEISSSKSSYIYDDKYVPRVTEILSEMLHNDSIVNWANGLGFKHISYRKFLNEAADKGTYSHLAIERFMKYGYTPKEDTFEYPPKLMNVVMSTFNAFKSWWDKLHKDYKKIEVVYSEEKLVCEYFGGTCDCVLRVDGEYWLIDFKTSNHMSYNYPLQLAAYGYMFEHNRGIYINRYIVLRLDKAKSVYYDYELNMNTNSHKEYIKDCLTTFMSLVLAFKMRYITTQQYEEIFGKYK